MTALKLIPILLLAFGLRVFRLNGQSFWSDEGASVFMTGRSFGDILQAAAGDIHPPLYYLFLRYWSVPTGTTEFAVRFLSLMLGVLLVILVYKLGKRLASRDVGLVAAFLAATSPFLIYYSQEARMYMQMATLSTLSVVLAMNIWRGLMTEWRKPGWGFVSYIIVTAACLYTQYYAFTIVLFENVLFVLAFWRVWRSWRIWSLWAGSQLAVAVLFLPWIIRVLGQLSAWPAISEDLSFQTLVYRVFLVFSFGLSWDVTATEKAQALFAGLLVIGVGLALTVKARWLRVRRLTSALHHLRGTLLYLLVPLGIMYYLSLSRPMYNPKFLLLATPPFYVLLGLGIIALREVIAGPARKNSPVAGSVGAFGRWTSRPRPALAAAFVLAALAATTFFTGRSLGAYYFDAKYARDDYRGLAGYIAAASRPDDAIILNAPSQSEIFGYYYKGSLPVLPIPGGRPLDERTTEDDLKRAGERYRRIWVVFWAEKESDPRGFVERWLNQNTFRAGNRWYGNVRLVLYSLPTTTAAGTVQQQVDANFGDKISLLGFSLSEDRADQTYEARPGEVLQLTLFWQALAKMDQRYTVFTHLLDSHEHIWGQRDAEPGSSAKPTTSWTPGAVISDNYGIPILFGTPPGDYYVEAGIYQAATGKRLPVQGRGGTAVSDRVLFGPLTVGRADAPPSIASLNARYPYSGNFGPIRLVGYDFGKLGSEGESPTFGQGDLARLALYWQAGDRPGKDYDVVVRLLDASGRAVFTRQNPPADGNYPTGRWDKGEIVLDQHKLPLNLPPGKYRLTVGIEDGKTKPVELREVAVVGGKG